MTPYTCAYSHPTLIPHPPLQIWDEATGDTHTSIQPPEGDINDLCIWPGTGLICLPCDTPKVHSFFVPSLGPAPRWASFLEGLTEELEENATPVVYDDYRYEGG